jgi:DNA end-binding protein Ku
MLPATSPAPTPESAGPIGQTGSATASLTGPPTRPSWSGLLRISLVGVPVKAFAAVSTASASHFHMLHADCGQRLQYQKHCPQHGVVSAEAIVRGYEYARDRYVVVEPEELEQLRPAHDKALVLEQFVPVAAVDPTFFAGRSLYLLPDGPAAQHPYGLLVETMHEAGKAALGRVVFTSQRQLVLVRPSARLLVVDVLHYPAQVRGPATWQEQVGAATATEAERDLARQLLALASGPLDWSRYRDTSAAELAALIEAKVAQQPLPKPADEPAVVLRLLDALKQSVEAAQRGRDANQSKGRKPQRWRALA